MNTIKPICLQLLLLVLAGCGTQNKLQLYSNNISAPLNIKIKSIKGIGAKTMESLGYRKWYYSGMSVDRAYAELLKDKKGVPVIVGIVDSGWDIEHEDLKTVLWTNTKEIAGNGIDDDKMDMLMIFTVGTSLETIKIIWHN
jgi:hypothetical protein